MSLVFTGDFMSWKSSLFKKSWSAFVVLAGRCSAEFMYLTKHHLKHALPLIFEYQSILFLDAIVLLVVLYNCYQLRDCILKY